MSKFSDKAKAVLGAIAPELGIALGGPFGGLAGAAIAKALGTKGPDDPATEAAILSGDNEALLKIKQANNDFLLQMEKLGVDRDKLVYDDIANARAREVAVKDNTPKVLAYAVTAGFFATLTVMIFHGKPTTGGDALLVMLGSLGTAWAAIMAYYYGSSKSSDAKTQALTDIAKAP